MAKHKKSKFRRSKKNSEKTYKKCIKQFSIPIEEELFDYLVHEVQAYQPCRNYIYFR